MNLLDVVREVRRHLEENGRLSLRMLRRQFELDDDALAEVIEELVDVQRVARREENALAWSAAAPPLRHPAARARPALLHAEASRRQDPAIEVRPRRRAQAGHGALRRREGLDGAGRAARSGRVAPHPRPLLRDPHRGRAPLRGHGQPVHRRRHHGALRRADRARGSRAARLLRGAPPARRARALRHRGEARARRRLLDAHGHQLGRGGGRQDRRRPAHGLHGAGPHRRARAAHGGARRARTPAT